MWDGVDPVLGSGISPQKIFLNVGANVRNLVHFLACVVSRCKFYTWSSEVAWKIDGFRVTFKSGAAFFDPSL